MSMERRGKGRALSAEEEALWQQVAATVTPLPHAAPAPAPLPGPGAGARFVGAPAAAVPASPALPATVPPAGRTARGKPKPGAAPAPPIADFETKAARRLASGKLPIDARLDLHGLRQDEAYTALFSFLMAAQFRGDRYVKVITGKGARPAAREDDMTPFRMGDDRRGVLKEQVPRWLSSPELRDLVVGFTEAGRSHGGSGALYVRLRRR